jgi:DNA-binding MarR family transcriptional regulator
MSSHSEHALKLNSTITHLIRRIRRIDAAQGIGRARLSALAVLHFGGPSSLTELAAAEMVTAATMHHVLKGLVSDKLVRKVPDAADRRRQEVRLTAKGTHVIRKAHAARLQFINSLLAGQPRKRIEEAIALLEAMDKD